MNVTRVYVELVERGALKAYCDVVLDDCFMVHGAKVVQGDNGLIVAMPSNRPKLACPECKHPSCPVTDDYCGRCGAQQPVYQDRIAAVQSRQRDGKFRAHYDVCHPLNMETRRTIEEDVLRAYRAKLEEPR